MGRGPTDQAPDPSPFAPRHESAWHQPARGRNCDLISGRNARVFDLDIWPFRSRAHRPRPRPPERGFSDIEWEGQGRRSGVRVVPHGSGPRMRTRAPIFRSRSRSVTGRARQSMTSQSPWARAERICPGVVQAWANPSAVSADLCCMPICIMGNSMA